MKRFQYKMPSLASKARVFIAPKYERDDFLLIREEKVIAVSANEDFNDGDHPTEVLDTDTVVKVICNGNEIPYLT
jgi:hypothetical protein